MKNPLSDQEYSLTDDETCKADDRGGLVSYNGGGAGNGWLLSLLNGSGAGTKDDPARGSILDLFSSDGTRTSLLEGTANSTDNGVEAGGSALAIDHSDGDTTDLLNLDFSGFYDEVGPETGGLGFNLSASLLEATRGGDLTKLLPISLQNNTKNSPAGMKSESALDLSLLSNKDKDKSSESLLPIHLDSTMFVPDEGGLQSAQSLSASVFGGETSGGFKYSLLGVNGSSSQGSEGSSMSGGFSLFDLKTPELGHTGKDSNKDAALSANFSVGEGLSYEAHDGDMDGDGHDERGLLVDPGTGNIGYVDEYQDIDGDGTEDWAGHIGLGPLQLGSGDQDGDGERDYSIGIDIPFFGKKKGGDGKGGDGDGGNGKGGDGLDTSSTINFTFENPLGHLEDGYNYVSNKVSDAANAVGNVVSDGWNATKDVASDGWDATKGWVNSWFD